MQSDQLWKYFSQYHVFLLAEMCFRLWSVTCVSFPGSPALEHEYVGGAWYLLSREHDIIGKGLELSEQKGNVSHVVYPTLRSTLGM